MLPFALRPPPVFHLRWVARHPIVGAAWLTAILAAPTLLGVLATTAARSEAVDAPPAIAVPVRAEPSPRDEPLTREAAAADLTYWRAQLVRVHPEPDHVLSARELDRNVAAAIAELPAVVDRTSLYLRIARIAARLGDSHTTIAPPAELVRGWRLGLVVVGERLCFERALATIPAGACVAAIGTQTAGELLDVSRRIASGESPAGVDRAAAALLPVVLAAAGASNETVVVAHDDEGRRFEAPLVAASVATEPPRAVEVAMLDDRVALVTMRTMVGDHTEDFARWFDALFLSLAREPVRGLVIDLRDNDGGSTDVGALLLSYLGTQPQRMMGAKLWRVSAPMQRFVRFDPGFDAPAYLAATPGDMLVGELPIEPPSPREHGFTGPTVLLVGPGTASAAMMTADAAREFGLALVVGEPTASPPNYFGEVFRDTLPHSGLEVRFSTAAFVRASGDGDDRSMVEPDVHAASSFDERIAGHDRALAVAWHCIAQWHAHRPAQPQSTRATPSR